MSARQVLGRTGSDVAERSRRALALAGDNRLRAVLLLDRWAGVLSGQDPELAAKLKARSRQWLRVEMNQGPGRFNPGLLARMRKEGSSRAKRLRTHRAKPEETPSYHSRRGV